MDSDISVGVATAAGLAAPFAPIIDAITRATTDAIDGAPQWLSWAYAAAALLLMMWGRYRQARAREDSFSNGS